MLQSSLKPGLLFHRCSSAYVTRFPVMCRTVSSADRQYVPRTSTSTPSTSKTRIFVGGRFFAAVTQLLEQKRVGVTTPCQEQPWLITPEPQSHEPCSTRVKKDGRRSTRRRRGGGV